MRFLRSPFGQFTTAHRKAIQPQPIGEQRLRGPQSRKSE